VTKHIRPELHAAAGEHTARQRHGRQEITLDRMPVRADLPLRDGFAEQHRIPVGWQDLSGTSVGIAIEQRGHARGQHGRHIGLPSLSPTDPGLQGAQVGHDDTRMTTVLIWV
jgi:hypothetical protein